MGRREGGCGKRNETDKGEEGGECERGRIWPGQGGALVVREGPMLLGILAPKIRSSGRQRFPPRIVDISSSTKSPPSGKIVSLLNTLHMKQFWAEDNRSRWSNLFDMKLQFWRMEKIERGQLFLPLSQSGLRGVDFPRQPVMSSIHPGHTTQKHLHTSAHLWCTRLEWIDWNEPLTIPAHFSRCPIMTYSSKMSPCTAVHCSSVSWIYVIL